MAPKLLRKVTTRTATPTIKPVVPVLPPAPASKAIPTKKESLGDPTPLNNDATEFRAQDVDLSEPLPNAEGKKPETKLDQLSAPVKGKKAVAMEKRGRPNKLNIVAVEETSRKEMEIAAEAMEDAKAKADAMFPPLAPSQPATPATVPSQPSAPPSAPQNKSKTIHLSSTPFNEIPSPGNAPSTGSRQASRRPSITSLARPDTPASERISDNVSYTSASMSRASSPPPNRVGSAPVRRVTKNQQKKERQTRAKHAEEEAVKKEEPAAKEEESVIQAPIVGRKKKTKKAKETTRGTADSTPAVTRPASPELSDPIAKEKMPPPPPKEPVKASKATKETKKQIKLPHIEPVEPEPTSLVPATTAPATTAPATDSNQAIPALTAAKILAHLQASGDILPAQIETLFKPIANIARFDHNFDPELIVNGSLNPTPLTPAQSAALDLGEPVGYRNRRQQRMDTYAGSPLP